MGTGTYECTWELIFSRIDDTLNRWPESFYLGTIQARQILYEVRALRMQHFFYHRTDLLLYKVLLENVKRGDLNEAQACSIAKRALFDTANRVYNLGLDPDKC